MRKPRSAQARKKAAVCSKPECNDFMLLLTEYWEGSDDAVLRREIEGHIRVCPECAEVFRSYAEIVTTFHSAGSINRPGPAHKELWDSLAEQLQALKDYLS